MKILSIGTDRNLFNKDSEVRQRIVEYGRLTRELHIIVFTNRFKNYDLRFKNEKIGRNVFVYQTNSRSRWFYIFDAVKLGEKIVHKSKFLNHKSLVTSQDPFESGFVGWILKKKFNLSLQLQIHTDFLSPYFWQESFLNKIRVILAKFLIPRANCIRVVSKRIADSLRSAKVLSKNRLSLFSRFVRKARPHLRFCGRTFAPRVTVLPIFVNVEKIKSSSVKTDLHKKYSQFDFVILMASRLTKEKNIGLAIDTMSDILAEYSKAGLVLVGEGQEQKNLKSQISNLKIDGNIIIENWTDDLSSYYKTADLFLLTSNYEGYGRTLVEAAAAGCNIISSDVGIANEILEKENIFEVGSEEQLTEKIIEAIKGNIQKARPLELYTTKTKAEYLKKYKKSWELCVY